MTLGEIDRDFYCSAFNESEFCSKGYVYCKEKCGCLHRKHPTPEQFKEEYGEEYHDDGAVYYRSKTVECRDDQNRFYLGYTNWYAVPYSKAKHYKAKYSEEIQKGFEIVCACTPFGKPDDSWRPQ